jgi:deazaflavin-dependent oxidoreductase (nitroreductase family)
MRWRLRHGLAPRAFALRETTGRAGGRPRYTCGGNGLDGDTFRVLAAHGRQADWVRNIIKDPQVRVLAGRGWRHGTACLMPEDDTAPRSRALSCPWDAAVGRAIATTPLTVASTSDRPVRVTAKPCPALPRSVQWARLMLTPEVLCGHHDGSHFSPEPVLSPLSLAQDRQRLALRTAVAQT